MGRVTRAALFGLVFILVSTLLPSNAVATPATPGPSPTPAATTHTPLAPKPRPDKLSDRPAHPSEKPHLLQLLPKDSVKDSKGSKVLSHSHSIKRKLVGEDAPAEQELAQQDDEQVMAQVPPDGGSCQDTFALNDGPVSATGFATLNIEGQTVCTPLAIVANNAIHLQLVSLDFALTEFDDGGLNCGVASTCSDAAQVGPFDWGSSHQLMYQSQVTLDPAFVWVLPPNEGCAVSGQLLTCNYTLSHTIIKAPPAPSQLGPTGLVAETTPPQIPAFSWSTAGTPGVDRADLYALQVQDAAGNLLLNNWFLDSEAGCATGAVCTITPPTLALRPFNQGQPYFWWVLGSNAAGNGPWSIGLSFEQPVTCNAAEPDTEECGDTTVPGANAPDDPPREQQCAARGPLDSRPIGGTGVDYDRINGHGVYVLRDPATGQVKYVGRGDAPARLLDHARPGSPNSDLVGQIIANNNLCYEEARGLEQKLMDQYANNGLRNLIRGIALSNKNLAKYLRLGLLLLAEAIAKIGPGG